MPGKYSHALVLAGYEYRGLIDRHSPPTSPQFEPPIPASDSSRLSPSPSTSFNLSQSRSSTPTTTAAAYRSNGISDAQSQSNRLRSLSTTRSVSSYSTESSSHAAASVVTQIYAPLPPITSSTQVNQRRYSDNATTPPASAHRSESHSNPSPQTTRTLSNHSSSPRSNSTVNTSINSTSLIPTITEKAVDEDEIYFGSDEEESDSFSTLSLPSSCQYIIKPWEHPDLHPDHFQFKTHYPPDSDDSQASSQSRQRGSSPDDAVPPPIARTRRVEFAQPPISSKSDLPGTKRASIIRRLSFLRPVLSLSLPLPQRRLSHSNHFSTGHPMSIPNADTSSRPLPIPTRKSETLEPQPLEADHVKPTTRPWQASTFEIPWMDEAERNRYREKGVNPQLMAEMKSHRRGKWMGPLVGNTFIG